jgi:integrase
LWSHVDLDNGVILVERSMVHLQKKVTYKLPKSGQTRRVLLASELVDALREIKKQQALALLRLGIRQGGATPVLLRHDGTQRSPGGLSWQFKELSKKAGTPSNCHQMRHSHASQLLKAGVSVPAAARRLGHADNGRLLLATYAHVEDDRRTGGCSGRRRVI